MEIEPAFKAASIESSCMSGGINGLDFKKHLDLHDGLLKPRFLTVSFKAKLKTGENKRPHTSTSMITVTQHDMYL